MKANQTQILLQVVHGGSLARDDWHGSTLAAGEAVQQSSYIGGSVEQQLVSLPVKLWTSRA
jgi:hypothetical protein